jgi:hypothetical protein
MRHGRIDELKGVSSAEVDDAVKDDIESIMESTHLNAHGDLGCALEAVG